MKYADAWEELKRKVRDAESFGDDIDLEELQQIIEDLEEEYE